MTHTAARGGGTDRSAARWSDLPDDLLGLVRFRIASPRDRVRFSVVCRSWRARAAASRQPARPADPLLLLWPWKNMGTSHPWSPDYSWAVHAPSKAVDKAFLGTHDGGWVAANDDHVLMVIDLFSGVEVKLPPKQSMIAKPSLRSPMPHLTASYRKSSSLETLLPRMVASSPPS